MNHSDFLAGISFRSIQPTDQLPGNMFFADDFALQSTNTVLPADGLRLTENIRSVWDIPKMSTFAIGAILNRFVSQLAPGHTYVNVGVWNGFTFLAGLVNHPDKTCIGIDNFSGFGGPRDRFQYFFQRHKSENHSFHEMDYVEYFKRVHKEPIGCYLFDGPHDYHNQLQAMQIAEPYFANGCVILVDDTNWADPRRATLDFIASRPGRYRILLDAPTAGNGHPTYWNGLIVFQHVQES
ncbi:class I SAM-dependent methyltransferase [Brevibacillus thermoruber]|uniref:Class I SAM-dependent methyltransferase n=1 Tax=Brevibacillus thermoruber TaxID=33942 RepID=A0A9X3Z3N7_9BACL|nr:class I SAM-dependent methyltransferase [Brevibacillus thermoruber]MDA5108933.1 class I SAM-dependent methyltransferase [Brevibacillus thermoruber]